MNIEEIKELIKEVSASELVQFDLQEGNIKLSLKKEGAIVHDTLQMLNDENTKWLDAESKEKTAFQKNKTDESILQNNTDNNIIPQNDESVTAASNGIIVKSPLVGTAHLINEETGEPFVTVGTRVKKGQTLAVVEAMKMMNDIEAETDGVVEKILIEDGATVEYNGEMFVICQNA